MKFLMFLLMGLFINACSSGSGGSGDTSTSPAPDKPVPSPSQPVAITANMALSDNPKCSEIYNEIKRNPKYEFLTILFNQDCSVAFVDFSSLNLALDFRFTAYSGMAFQAADHRTCGTVTGLRHILLLDKVDLLRAKQEHELNPQNSRAESTYTQKLAEYARMQTSILSVISDHSLPSTKTREISRLSYLEEIAKVFPSLEWKDLATGTQINMISKLHPEVESTEHMWLSGQKMPENLTPDLYCQFYYPNLNELENATMIAYQIEQQSYYDVSEKKMIEREIGQNRKYTITKEN